MQRRHQRGFHVFGPHTYQHRHTYPQTLIEINDQKAIILSMAMGYNCKLWDFGLMVFVDGATVSIGLAVLGRYVWR
jgi:hypothetical protein